MGLTQAPKYAPWAGAGMAAGPALSEGCGVACPFGDPPEPPSPMVITTTAAMTTAASAAMPVTRAPRLTGPRSCRSAQVAVAHQQRKRQGRDRAPFAGQH